MSNSKHFVTNQIQTYSNSFFGTNQLLFQYQLALSLNLFNKNASPKLEVKQKYNYRFFKSTQAYLFLSTFSLQKNMFGQLVD